MKKFLIFVLFILGCFNLFRAQSQSSYPPIINVVYPKENSEIGAVDSTFILGSVTPGVKLEINGFPVNVYRNGGFLAFLPVTPGEFIFNLKASSLGGVTEKIHTVKIAYSFKPTPVDSVLVQSGWKYPNEDWVLISGDILPVSFRGTPGCQAFFKIQDVCDWQPMTESMPSKELFWEEEVFGKLEDTIGINSKGIYKGSYLLQKEDLVKNAKVYFKLQKKYEFLDPLQPEWVKIDTLNCMYIVTDSARGKVSVEDYQIFPVVEFKDTTQIVRTGPGLAYHLIFQPQGVKTVVTGRRGSWIRLKLSEDEEGWVDSSKVAFLPEGTPIPESKLTLLRTEVQEDKTILWIPLSEKLPFKIEPDVSNQRLSIFIYRAVSNINWIRYDAADKIISLINWNQIKKDVCEIKVNLKTRYFWGYDTYYVKNSLAVVLKKPPVWQAGTLKGLKITLDPGHSADDGAIGPTGYKEKEANLEIARRVKKVLENAGAKVTMTRIGMENVALYDRPKIALNAGTDIYISIHCNAVPDGVNPLINNGTSTYYYHPQSQLLAEKIHSRMVKNLEVPDYGLYFGNFAVIRPTQYPAVLVECAFIILPEQEQLLRKPVFQQNIAKSIYRGVLDFLQSVK